jgi:hypothetical protein
VITREEFIGRLEEYVGSRGSGMTSYAISDIELGEVDEWRAAQFYTMGTYQFNLRGYSTRRKSNGLAEAPIQFRYEMSEREMYYLLDDELRYALVSAKDFVFALMSGAEPKLIGQIINYDLDPDLIKSLMGGE